MAQAMPGSAPFLLRMIQWSMAAFKASAQIEGVLDQAIAALEQKEKQPKEPNPQQQAELAETQAAAMEKRAGALKDITDSIEKMAMIGQPLPVPIQAILDGGLMGADGQTVQMLAQKIDQLAATANAPKRVVRDQMGKVVGVAPVPPQAPPQMPPQAPMPQPQQMPVGAPNA
jgi:hypothetical protein